MACALTVNQHGILTFRIYFEGRDIWRSTGKPDTAENRREVDALAVIISTGIKNKTFFMDWFQDEAQQNKPDNKTVGGYFAEWILRKKPPMVCAGLERDYRDHFNRYILPRFGNVNLVDVTPRRLEGLRGYLLNERGLAMKTAQRGRRYLSHLSARCTGD